jgi:uncharacterized protein YxeA
MKDDENIASYFLQVDETVNAIIGLREEIEESVIVQKVLRSLPMRFDPKISALEERSYLNSISMDGLHGIFTTYEMRTEQENPYVKEAAFKASKRSKQKENQQEEHSSTSEFLEANATSKEKMAEWESLTLVWKKEYFLVTQVQGKHTSVII